MTGVLARRAAACIAGFYSLQARWPRACAIAIPILDNAKRLASELQRATFHSGPFYLLSSFQIADIGYERSDQFFVPTEDQTSGITLNVDAPHRLLLRSLAEDHPLRRRRPRLQRLPPRRRLEPVQLPGPRRRAVPPQSPLPRRLRQPRRLRCARTSARLNRLVTAARTTIGVNGEIKYSSRTSFLVAGSERDTSYPRSRIQPDDQPVERLDRTEQNLRLSGIHKTFRKVSLSLAAEGSEYDFDNQPGFTNSQRRYVAPGLIWEGDRAGLRIEGGPATLTFDGGRRRIRRLPGRHRRLRAVGAAVEQQPARQSRPRFFGVRGQQLLHRRPGGGAADVRRDPALEPPRDRVMPAATATNTRINGVKREDDLSFISGGFLHTTRRMRGGVEVGYFQRDSNFRRRAPEWNTADRVHLSFTP